MLAKSKFPESALDLIEPKVGEREFCKWWVVFLVEYLSGTRKLPAAGAKRESLRNLAAKLRAVERAGNGLLSQSFIEDVSREREAVEKKAGKIVTRKGSRRRDPIKVGAVHYAHGLIEKIGDRRPTLTRNGAWHKLALELFAAAGGSGQDLFEYIERYDKGDLEDRWTRWQLFDDVRLDDSPTAYPWDEN
jgi:hypothetical protein